MRQVFRTRPWVLQKEPGRFIDFFKTQGELLELSKGSFLSHGSLEGYVALLVEGLVSFAFVDINSQQRIFALILPGRLIGDLDALNPKRPAVIAECLRPSKVLAVKNHDFRQFMRQSIENMELHADLSVLKEEAILEGAFANFTMDLDMRLRALFLSLLQAEGQYPEIPPEGAPMESLPWYPCPVALSVTEISRVVAATRSWVSVKLSEWCEAGLMKKEVHAMSFRAALFSGLHDWMQSPANVRPTSILVQ